MEINHANIFYVRDIHKIGGVETYVYELAKKYKDYDNAVVCKSIALEQLKRLKKYCKVYIHKNEQINCKVIITNWDTSIFDYVNEDAKKYTVLHTDYSNPTERLGIPQDRPDITYIGITESSKKAFEDITGIDRTILCRNPYELEVDKPVLTLLSATRLSQIKGGDRMLKLANTLNNLGINYIWYIITTDEYSKNPIWKNKNVVHIPNRLDVDSFMRKADWYVQLSECEGDSYSLKEALYRGLPIVVCELPYFKEIGIEEGKNALFYNLNNSNVLEVAEKMRQPLKFNFNKIQDGYNEILDKTKSYYKEEKEMKARVKALKKFETIRDSERNVYPKEGEEWITSKERAEILVENEVAEIVEIIKEETPVVTSDVPHETKEEKPKKKGRRKIDKVE